MSDEQQDSAAVAVKPLEKKLQQSEKRGKTSIFFKALLVLLVLLAMAAAGYDYWLLQGLQSQQQQRANTTQAVQKLLVDNQQTLKQQQVINSSLRGQLNSLESQQLSLYEANIALKRRLQELSHTDRSDWQLAEVEYMLRLAHQRVISSNNAKLGLELLLSADELIRELDTAELFVIRKQIARDVMALRNAVDVDVEGLYLSLSALAKAVQDIQFNQTELKLEASTTEQATGIARLWRQLASLYRITPRSEIVKPLYSHEQQQSIRQQLLLLVAQSRQALLTESSALYVASLAEAKDLAQRYGIDDDALRVFIAQLDTFTALSIVPELPDISSSHAKMRDYIDSKRRRGLVVVDASAPENEAK